VRLYRAEAFPEDWVLEKVLYDAPGRDTTVWHDGGTWWFFTTLTEPRGGGIALVLFHSDTLTGEWVAHPRNPIVTDVRSARGGGAIFRDDHGRLVRPSQDCSRTYGYSFSLNEIVSLSRDEYEERPLLTVRPDWSEGLTATHTYARSARAEAVDGRTKRTVGPTLRTSLRFGRRAR
jgi:hypothetical protein